MGDLDEWCPFCNCETSFNLEKAVANNGKIICEHCGEEIMACSICSSRDCNSKECFKYSSDIEKEETA